MKKIEAVRWEVKEKNGVRSIQLFDKNGKKVKGCEASWGGGFYCYNNKLTSLEGAPSEVGGDFYCDNNQLTSLEGAPSQVGGDFYYYNNKLTSLAGAPSEVGGDFYCYYNQLTSLEGAPSEVGGDFYCDNNQLTSLEGAPSQVGGSFYCYNNHLTSLAGAPSEVGGDFYCDNNHLTSEKGKPKLADRQKILARITKAKLKRGYLLADGILQRVISTKKKGKITIYKTACIGSGKTAYVVRDKDIFSHGNTLKEALADLVFKTASKDKSKYEKWTLKTTKSKEDMIIAYRVITGACQFGVIEFLKGKRIKSKLSVKEAVNLTKGQYGSQDFARFFGGE